MSILERFRRNAEECRDLARTARDAEQRQTLLNLAEWWEERARQFEQRAADETSPSQADDPPDADPDL